MSLQANAITQAYTGVTHDLQERLAMHNAGHVPHTSKFAPWYIETAIAFRDKEKAFAYERYLKTGAGRAYAITLPSHRGEKLHL